MAGAAGRRHGANAWAAPSSRRRVGATYGSGRSDAAAPSPRHGGDTFVAEQMFLVEVRRDRMGDRPAGIARFILTAGSRYAALSKLRVYYETAAADSVTATPISGVVPIAGALVHDMLRRPPDVRTRRQGESPSEDDGEEWKK
jgi:hypothetical protein